MEPQIKNDVKKLVGKDRKTILNLSLLLLTLRIMLKWIYISLSLILLSTLSYASAAVDISHCSEADNSQCLQAVYKRESIILKSKLQNNYNIGKETLDKVDQFFVKISSDKATLNWLNSEVQETLSKISADNWGNDKIKDILLYLQYKVGFYLQWDFVWVLSSAWNSSKLSEVEKLLEVHPAEIVDYMIELYNDSQARIKLIIDEIYTTEELSMISSNKDDQIRFTYLKSLSVRLDYHHVLFWNYPSVEQFNTVLVSSWLDTKAGLRINWCDYWYRYQVGEKSWVKKQAYKLSACILNEDKAREDWWEDPLRYEIWVEWTNFSEPYYINGISTWEVHDGDNFSLIPSHEKSILYVDVIYLYYSEFNKEKIIAYETELDQVDFGRPKILEDMNSFGGLLNLRSTTEDIQMSDYVDLQTTHTAIINGKEVIVYQWTADFITLKKDPTKDVLNPYWKPYIVAYIIWDYWRKREYIYEIWTIDWKWDKVVSWTYSPLQEWDSGNIIKLK